MKDELGGSIMIEFVALRPNTYSYLKDDGSEHKRVNWTKKCLIKRILKFNHYNDFLFNTSQYYNQNI